ncbi:hypothetical protein HXX76_004203 [Chlamydomonas incerta]|uniref:Uncharacterized protein n=1 Tax=Chlamydomonas incerta TaxID=51695 RepID=A0A835TGV1_CHLIN|nr:hypothetical protein HXX76_004203 [Chlamydomonas incerta]|eukprot:KAG2440089.1 hypothetical protein HXX76_004203 [Chlamydomonas incerta]
MRLPTPCNFPCDQVLWDLLEPDDEGPEWEAGLPPRERQLLATIDPGLLASRAATALAHFSTVPRAVRQLLRQRPGSMLAGGTFHVAVQLPLMVVAAALDCSVQAAVVMCAEEPRLLEVPVVQLEEAREALRMAVRSVWRLDTRDDAAAAELLRARPSLALLPVEVLMVRATTLAFLPDWRVLAELGGGDLNRWLNPEDMTAAVTAAPPPRAATSSRMRGGTTQLPPAHSPSSASATFPGEQPASGGTAGGHAPHDRILATLTPVLADVRMGGWRSLIGRIAGAAGGALPGIFGTASSAGVVTSPDNPGPVAGGAEGHSPGGGGGCTEQPRLKAVLAPSDAPYLAAALTVPLHVMLRLLWLRDRRGSCEYAVSVLRLRYRRNDANAVLACWESWPHGASAGALAAADHEPSDVDKVTWLLKPRDAWEEDAVGFVCWLQHNDAISGGVQGASSGATDRFSKNLWGMALEGM